GGCGLRGLLGHETATPVCKTLQSGLDTDPGDLRKPSRAREAVTSTYFHASEALHQCFLAHSAPRGHSGAAQPPPLAPAARPAESLRCVQANRLFQATGLRDDTDSSTLTQIRGSLPLLADPVRFPVQQFQGTSPAALPLRLPHPELDTMPSFSSR